MIRIDRFIKFLAQHEWLEVIELPEWEMQRARYIGPGVYEYMEAKPTLQRVERLSSTQGTTYFLKKTLDIPEHWGLEEVALVFEAGGEALLRINGEESHGLDRNHMFVPLRLEKVGQRPLLEIELFDPIPEPVDPLNQQAVINPPISGISSRLVRVNGPVRSLKHTVAVANMAAGLLPEQDMRRIRTEQALTKAMDALYGAARSVLEDAELVQETERRLEAAVKEQMPEDSVPGIMHMVGQSHIDVAWLWPVRETVRKVSRTFSTVCALMDQYPDFKYSQSQPQLYAFAKEHYPDLFEKIKARAKEGRWELVGGMWVEPDLNLPSGESLVRQILYGQRFYEQEFGKRSGIEWLPDTFGYCASLPQILKLAGIEYFMTTKLGWNDTNKFPYDLFHWVGIDGTAILAYQNHGVNEHTHPKDVQEHWKSFGQKDVHQELMLLYGHGDGGGGVTEEMVEFVERASLMPGQPLSRFATAADFFEGVKRQNPKLPKWHGDLYLELHRGTYTTHAHNKRNNRKAEVLYREAEIWSNFPDLGRTADQEVQASLNDGWKLMLLNQFHDIIPGTAIPEVYETSAKEYKEIFRLGNQALNRSLLNAAAEVSTDGVEGQPCIVFNSLGWERDEIIELGSDTGLPLEELAAYDECGQLECDLLTDAADPLKHLLAIRVPGVPAFGCKTIWLRSAEKSEKTGAAMGSSTKHEVGSVPHEWETEFYLLSFNEKGEIIRWFDKCSGRELIAEGGKANELQFFHDTPTYWDAWDIDPRYEDQRAGAVELISSEVVVRGKTQDVLRFHWKLNESEIEQEVVLYHHRRRVDFRTKVNWREGHKLLKVAFPVDIVADKATYEIPFGSLERPTHRNTSWEQAQFEVCGHRWADLSEGGYGISLLNDCKYGYDIKEGVMRLSLLRAPTWPDKGADQGEHQFTYSLYPHAGDWRGAHVVREAVELNHPASFLLTENPQNGTLPAVHSWLKLDAEHVVLETVKPAEDGSGTILRFYESSGSREKVSVQWPTSNMKAYIVGLLEDEKEEILVQDGNFELVFKPYEIKSVKISVQSNTR
ncbi:alpha-mannosidase [Paenibacillus puldeungensis]|uniref:Alpha-mannosidase n=1 Tax=Paenibacillus puldeungensis TaxID=696536 RepID=A0ABW3RRE0_9BACL